MLSKKEQKFIKSLKIKKYRVREKRFLVEGAKNVQEVLNSDFNVELLVGSKDFFSHQGKVSHKLRMEVAGPKLLSELGSFKTNDSALAVVEMKREHEFVYDERDHLIVLDGVGDPGNLGTIIRTLDWFGFKNLLCSLDCAELYNPKVIASSMGSFTRLNVYYQPLEEVFSKVQIPILGADLEGADLYQRKIEKPSIVVMGSESNGLSHESQQLLTGRIKIPKLGNAESLNVGIATGIIASYLRMP